MKKFITSFVFFIFSFGIFIPSFASDSTTNYSKQAIIHQTELNKTTKGKQYIKTADAVIVKYGNDEAFLKNLQNKLIYGNLSAIKDTNLPSFLNYLNAKINIALETLQEYKASEILTPTISTTDKKFVDNKIIPLQQDFITKLETLIKTSLKQAHHKETGNLKVNFEFDEETIGQIKTTFNLSNYEAITNNFDVQIKGDLSLLVSALSKGDGLEHKLDLNSAIDYILKDENIYILLQNFNIIDIKNLDELQEMIDKIKELAEKNQYLKIGNSDNKRIYQTLKSFNQDKILADVEEMAKNPLLEAYKNEGDKYYLRPTKFVCNNYKKVSLNIGNLTSLPGISDECNDKEYSQMLEKFVAEIGQLSLQINGETTTIGLTNDNINLTISIIGKVFEISGKFLDKGTQIVSLNISGNFDNDDVLNNFNLTLDSQVIKSNISIKNKVITGNTTILMNGTSLITISETGNYTKNTVDIKVNFSMSDEASELLAMMLGKSLKLSGNLSIKTDHSNNKNDVNILLNVQNNGKIILKYDVINEGKIENGSVGEIKEPENVIDLEEFQKLNSSFYTNQILDTNSLADNV